MITPPIIACAIGACCSAPSPIPSASGIIPTTIAAVVIKIGRKRVLFITITMMGICTTLIGVLPTYAQVGIFAPVLLVTLRIIQGLGAGAEISGAGTMLAEYAPKGKRGIISSLVAMGTNCGTLSATAIWAIMFFLLDREELVAWGWRIPFLLSAVLVGVAMFLCKGTYFSIQPEMGIPTTVSATAVAIATFVGYIPDMFVHTMFGNWIDAYGDAGYTKILFYGVGTAVLGVIAAVWAIAQAKKVAKRNAAAANAA